MRDGQPGVVRDLRVEGTESVVLRLAPVGAVDSFDLSVSPSDLKPMQGLPANYVNAGASLLHGGFVPGDMVFALKDIVVQTTETESGTSVAVGCGDVGMVFGDAISAEARQKGELLIRFKHGKTWETQST